MPPFNPKYPDFKTDIGVYPLNKYIRGIMMGIEEGRYEDVRKINVGKPLEQLFKRFSHTAFSETEYK